MSEMSARWALPLLQAGQAQKEITHNEALTAIDALLHPCMEAVADQPPAAPEEGRCWMVGTAPTGVWSGHAGQLAAQTGGGWRFLQPMDGMAVWVRSTGRVARMKDGQWFSGAAPIADPAGGGTVDGAARTAITAILVSLRQHGLIGS